MEGRCPWAGRDPLYQAYHDEEWGVPLLDDRRMFEMLVLEGFQAGLSWITILRKRESFRRAFDGFDPEIVARYDEAAVAARLADPGIVRNAAKIRAAIANARAWLALRDAGTSLTRLLWDRVDGRPIQNSWRDLESVPAYTPLSEATSRELKKRGFRFVGPTIVYSHMQATGLVNDHLVTCPRHAACAALGEQLPCASA